MPIFLALSLLLSTVQDTPKPKVGDPAPAFSLKATTGGTVRLSDFQGKKKVVLAFFPKAFTAGCTKEMGTFQEQQPMFNDASAQILGVSMDPLATQVKFAESLKLTFPILSDKGGAVAAAYHVKGALWANRATFVIDESGKIISIIEGKDAIDPGIALAACKGSSPAPVR
jgi:peroxiredoxin Q/BCP